jgi:hypothetical protein
LVRRVELELGVRRGLLGRAAGRVVEERVLVRWMGLLLVLKGEEVSEVLDGLCGEGWG